jgi:hypothetical protein
MLEAGVHASINESEQGSGAPGQGAQCCMYVHGRIPRTGAISCMQIDAPSWREVSASSIECNATRSIFFSFLPVPATASSNPIHFELKKKKDPIQFLPILLRGHHARHALCSLCRGSLLLPDTDVSEAASDEPSCGLLSPCTDAPARARS